MKVVVTGGCGYKGSVLIPKLLDLGHEVVSIDTQWFGDCLPEHPRLARVKIDIRDLDELPIPRCDAVIHLAGIANDPCGNLDQALTWEVAGTGTMRLMSAAINAGVQQFIFASSASVYGIREEDRISEELPLTPVSTYNRSKMVAERVVLSYSDKISVQIIRPATVCGLSPRMRLDVAVNLLTMQALVRGRISVLGGLQFRPNIHIQDITDLYCWLLYNPKVTGIYNAGYQNLTVMQIAQMVSERTGADVMIEPSNDPRSYRLDSEKLASVGFSPKKKVEDAIEEIVLAYRERRLVEHDSMYNVNWMRSQVVGSL